jgi:hypothetical protein
VSGTLRYSVAIFLRTEHSISMSTGAESRRISGRLSGASLSKDEIEKQIEESESLHFGSATFWNTFL